MNAESIQQWRARRPFEPFLIALSNGETYQVRHPENVIVFKSKLILGFPETESTVHVSLIHVNSVKAVQPIDG